MSNTFQIDGRRFELLLGNYDQVSTKERLVVLKPLSVMEFYLDKISQVQDPVLFEIGIFEAGSVIAMALLNKNLKVIGIDKDHKEHLNEIVAALGLQDRVKLHFGVDQTDEARIRQILFGELGRRAVDLAIDDGSHMYALSRRSLEIVLPFVRKGGFYSVEDWNWGHYGGEYQTTKWVERPALTNLVFELVIAAGSDSADITGVDIRGISAVVIKGSDYDPDKAFDLGAQMRMRNKTLTLI